MTINKDKIKKYLYPASFVLFIILIVTLTSKTKTFKTPTSTVPLFDNTSQSLQKNTDTSIISNITPVQNLTPTDFGEAKIENDKIIIGEKTIDIKDKINFYNVSKNLIVIESGDIYGENKIYYLYNLNGDSFKKIPTDRIKQVVSYSISPDTNSIYFLGNYDVAADKSTLYLYDTQNDKFTLLQSQIAANKIAVVNFKTIALLSEKHIPRTNVKINLFSAQDNKFLDQNLTSSDHLFCFNSKQFSSYNITTKTLTITNLVDNTKKELISGLVTDAMHLFCNNNSYFLVERQEDKTIFNNLGPDFNLVSKKEVKNTTQKTYIQSFIHNEKLINKYLDKTKDTFYLSQD